jgi:hypothetical protein
LVDLLDDWKVEVMVGKLVDMTVDLMVDYLVALKVA